MAEPASLFTAISAVGSLLGGAGSLFSAAKKPPKAAEVPTPKAPAVSPVPDDEAANRARRRQVAAIQSRSGRASTILTDFGRGDTLG